MNTSDLVQPRHLTRRAAIYVRQSSPHQVVSNKESQRLQYALRQRAEQLGWHEQDVDIVDVDLGKTAATTKGRIGFQEIVAQVALGKLGILLAYDATRLARNCAHWYQLLDLCGHHDCLIADRDGVYDPGSINGRLLLGLKGQISELELHTIRARLTAGILSKAERGELALTLPTGLQRLESGQVIKHPDREVTERIELIFEKLLERKSLAKTVRWFNDEDLKIPRRDMQGEIHWKQATVASLGSMVKNPAYAGAFAYGRTRSKKSEDTGKNKQTTVLPLEQWRYLVRDQYPAYITWETYQSINQLLRDNYAEYHRNKTRGVPRDGKALLHGIAYCGECGHKMCVQYKGGTQYLCNHLRQQHGTPVCQRLRGDLLDDQVVQWFFEALSVAHIDSASQALRDADHERNQVLHTRRQQVERLRYQARLAERQFNKSDPDNRLVTGELERRWEEALRELKSAEGALANDEACAPMYAIPVDLLDLLKDIGPRLPELWNAKLLRTAQKKTLLRSLIDKVVLRRLQPDRVSVRVVWRGGAITSSEVAVSVGKFAWLSGAKEMEEAILEMARAGQSDKSIAEHLTAQGHRSPRREVMLESTVKNIRRSHGFFHRACQSHPRRVDGCLTVPQLARKLDVPKHWVYDRIHNGTIAVQKDDRTGGYLFPDKQKMIQQFRQLRDGQIDHVGCGRGYQDE
jgi:DNA invertase Pin-like site-specific DNA recombinase